MGNTLISKSETEKSGFQVISVKALSPAADCGLKANVDYIIKLNGDSVLNKPPDYIIDIVKVFLFHFISKNVCTNSRKLLIIEIYIQGCRLGGLQFKLMFHTSC